MAPKSPIDLLTRDIRKDPMEPRRNRSWEETRREFVRRHPQCEVCGRPATGELNVHHIIPFDIVVSCGRPDLELDFRNLITLCEGVWNHHLVVGHFGDWQSYNRHVRSDAKRPECMGQPGEKIRRMTWWVAEHQERPERYRSTIPSDKADMKALLDRMYPPL
jgi:HNH endonuclease